MQYGLPEHTIQAIRRVLAMHSRVEKAILYGSRAKGNYRTGSDIDLALQGDELDLSEQLAIEDELDDLLLPYKIDLSLLNQIENRNLLDHIQRVGRTFYENRKSYSPE